MKRSVVHDTFTIERTFPHPPARVWAALSKPEAKRRWFAPPEDWRDEKFEMDFRVGGKEVSIGGPKDGPTITYEARFYDIVPEQRIVSAYEMHVGEQRISVSLGTCTLEAVPGGTRYVYTEQGTYLDGSDDGSKRRAGSEQLADKLGRLLG
jgi:uncharacterized protein YndB with AHSA1/START domain